MVPPPVNAKFAAVPDVEEVIVTTLPAEPVIVQLETVIVPPAGNTMEWATVLVDAKVANVELAVNVVVEVPVVPPIVRLL